MSSVIDHKGNLISSAEQLIELCKHRKSVLLNDRRIPAAIICNCQFNHIMSLISHACLYEYIATNPISEDTPIRRGRVYGNSR